MYRYQHYISRVSAGKFPAAQRDLTCDKGVAGSPVWRLVEKGHSVYSPRRNRPFLESALSLRLHAHNLACERDDRWLFRGLDLDIRAGEIVRVEGPNGSGKTTLLKILSGQLADYEGELYWDDRPMRETREAFLSSLLYLGHAPGVKAALTPLENLAWYQALAGQGGDESARLEALATVGLAGFEDVPAGQLSAGQQRRVALARLRLTPRPLWVLDEPFTAIDRHGVSALEQQLVDHARRGGCVLVTTHHELTPCDALRRISLGTGEGHAGL